MFAEIDFGRKSAHRRIGRDASKRSAPSTKNDRVLPAYSYARTATGFHRSVRRTVRKLCAQQHATTTAQLSNALAQKDVLLREKGVVKTPGHMNKFKIKVARIETTGRDEQNEQVCVTFQLDRRLTSFQVPVLLGINDFDDTEMVQAARNALHLIFAELASQSLEWKLTANDVKQLSSISMRPKS